MGVLKGCGILVYVFGVGYTSMCSLIDSFFRFHITLLLGIYFESLWNTIRLGFKQNANSFGYCVPSRKDGPTTTHHSLHLTDSQSQPCRLNKSEIKQTTVRGVSIDLIHKWRPIYFSFIFMLISLPSLVSMCKIQKNVCSKMRLGRLISMNIKEE